MDSKAAPCLNNLWAQLDGFFLDPTVKQKAFQFLRTTKQGKGELLPHIQAFDLKFYKAGLSQLDNAQKIDYLRNSLNKRLLRYQAGYQPPNNETYENFVQRMRVTWENLQAIDQSAPSAQRYPSLPIPQPANEEMDWTPTLGAMGPRTRRAQWGTPAQIQQRRDEGSCFRCGQQGHQARQCRTKAAVRPRKPTTPTQVATILTGEDDESEEGKEEP